VSRLRVLVLAPYPARTAPSQRFRFEQYLDPLIEEGFEFEVSTLLEPGGPALLNEPGHLGSKIAVTARAALRRFRDVARRGSFDLVFIHREAFPLGFPLFERSLAALGTPYIFDLDDAIYLPAVGDASGGFSSLRYPAKTKSIARHARLVTAGNRHLADWALQHNDDVRVIPTTIDTELYRAPPSHDSTQEGRSVCVGWSGSRTTIRYLAPLVPILRELQLERGIRIRVIGDEHFTIPGAEVEALPWREQSEIEDLSAIDIGLMPLPDDEWARGKCGLKALQYMALGVSAVISPIGVNVDIARGGAAMLASGEGEWRDAILELIENAERRHELGERGRERVEESYSVRANLPRYREVLSEAADG
jgi:glycosyltransferase involved in cell wall biosynthesis